MNDNERFCLAIENNDLKTLRQVPKADLHNHFYLGGNAEYIRNRTGVTIEPLNHRLANMIEMHQWVDKHIGNLFEDNRYLSLEACFYQALIDGVTVMEVGEDVWANDAIFNGDIDRLVQIFQSIHKMIAPDIEFRFQIGLSRHCPIECLETWVAPFLERDCFYSIDLYGDELAQPITNFKRIYRIAKERGLILKAHVGEWGDADSVKEAVETLELDEVQHGIAAAESVSTMYWLAEHKIKLNICPTSNIMLGRIERMEEHPIRTLYDHGVFVTVNTDDVLVFGQSLSQEFLNLYRAELFAPEELNQIRKNGLQDTF